MDSGRQTWVCMTARTLVGNMEVTLMKQIGKKITYNSPVVLTFALLSLTALFLGFLSGGRTTAALFSVYRAPLSDPLTWPRMVLHVLGHANLDHYIANTTLLLVVGPPLEEKYGSRTMLLAIFITAAASGLVNFIFFPSAALLGASGVVFMMILLSSLSGAKEGTIPLTLILVAVIYIGGELVSGIFMRDNVSHLTHIVGGVCGTIIGFALINRK